jgi:hypothetical protein
MPKKLKIYSSPPPQFGLVMIRTEKEALLTRTLARKLLANHLRGKTVEAGDMGIVLKSAVPKTRYGPALAAIRNDLARVRVVLQFLLNAKI